MPANPSGAALLDDFNRAAINGTALWPSTAFNTGAAATLAITANQLSPGGFSSSRSGRFATSFGADQEAYLDVAAVGGDKFLYLKSTGSNTTFGAIEVGVEANVIKCWVVTNNAFTELDAANHVSLTLAVGDSWGASYVGGTVTFWHKPSAGSWVAKKTWTDTVKLATTGPVSFEITGSTAPRYDNFRGGTVVNTTAVGVSLAQPYSVASSLASVGVSLAQPFTVTTAVGKSDALPYSIASALSAVGESLTQPYGVIGAVGKSLAAPYTLASTVAGESLALSYKVFRTLVRVGAGNNDATARSIVRTRDGRVFIFGQATGQPSGGTAPNLLAYRSDQTGAAITSFTQVDTANRPISTARLTVPDCILDPATGIVHMTYVDNASGVTNSTVYYQTFDTTGNSGQGTWGSREVVATGASGPINTGYPFALACSAIAYDLAGDIHVAYSASTSTVAHKRRTGVNTWSSATNISTGETSPIHHSLAVDYNGDLHLAWFSQESNRKMRYAKRTQSTGTWAATETAADNTGLSAENGVADHSNLDQCGSIVVDRSNQPWIMYLGNPGTNADDPAGNLVRIRKRIGGTWTSDHPTRTGFAGVHAHTPHLYMQGDDPYAFVAHQDAPELWPGYAVKRAGAWRPGDAEGVTFLFDGSAYISGTRTSTGAVGSAGSTLDGSAAVRYDPHRDIEPKLADVLFWDENFNGAGTNNGMLYYSAVPTDSTVVGASLAQPSAILTNTAVGKSLAQPYTVTTPVGRSLAQPSTVLATAGRSLAQPSTVTIAVGRSSAEPYTVLALASRSLGQPYTLLTVTGESLAQPYTAVAQIAKSAALPYQVLSVGVAGRSLSTPYGIGGLVGKSLVTPSTVLITTGRSVAQPYVVTVAVGKSNALPSVVLAARGRSLAQPYLVVSGVVGRSLALRYALVNHDTGVIVGPGDVGSISQTHAGQVTGSRTGRLLANRVSP